jgi:hypothetical protein
MGESRRVGVDDLSGDEARGVGGEKQRGADQVFRRLCVRHALHAGYRR